LQSELKHSLDEEEEAEAMAALNPNKSTTATVCAA